MSRYCRERSKWKTCNRIHLSSLHDGALMQKNRWVTENKVQIKEQEKEAVVSNTIKINKRIAMDVDSMIVPLNNEQKKVWVCTLLDDQSDVCVIKTVL